MEISIFNALQSDFFCSGFFSVVFSLIFISETNKPKNQQILHNSDLCIFHTQKTDVHKFNKRIQIEYKIT